MKGDMAWMKDPVNKVLGDLNALTDVANAATASVKGMEEMIYKVESIDPENPEVFYKIYFQGKGGAKGRVLGQIMYYDGKKVGIRSMTPALSGNQVGHTRVKANGAQVSTLQCGV